MVQIIFATIGIFSDEYYILWPAITQFNEDVKVTLNIAQL